MILRSSLVAACAVLLVVTPAAGQSRDVPPSPAVADSALSDTAIARIWKNLCGSAAPKDSAIVYGIVRDAKTRAPVPNAYVDVVWTQLIVDTKTKKDVHQRRLKLDTKADARGVFGMCGVPLGQFTRIGAGTTGRLSGLVDLPPGDERIIRRDLVIGAESDSAERGMVFGTLREVTNGTPLANARIIVDDSTEVRSGDDGKFVIRDLPTGTRQVEVLSIGMVPVVASVDVFPNDSTPMTFSVRRVTALDAVRVTASRRAQAIIDGLEERKRLGGGYLLEAGDIYAHSDIATVFAEFPSTAVNRSGGDITIWTPTKGGGMCNPDVWVDGARSAQYILPMLRMSEIVAVEMYPRAESVPLQFKNSTPTHACGVILLWTTWAFSR